MVSVFIRALPALSLHFFIEGPKFDEFGRLSGGIAPAIVGTFMLVVIASVIAVPIGVLTALWVSEFAPKRLGDQVKLYLDILNGFPSIVIGIFVYGLLVTSKVPILTFGGRPSAWAGGFALAIVMLPLISRTTMEVLSLVPNSLREASYALGVSKWRTVLQIILPTAIGGIMTGTTLAIARAAGETAPLLFVCAATTQTVDLEPVAGSELDPVHDLQRLRPGRRPGGGLGRGLHPDRRRPDLEPHLAILPRPVAAQARRGQVSARQAAVTSSSPLRHRVVPPGERSYMQAGVGAQHARRATSFPRTRRSL